MSRIIEFNVLNNFTEDHVLRITMPYNPFKSLTGYYSRLWRGLKPAVADTEKVDKLHISLKVIRRNGKTDRTLFEWPNGVKLDMPANATAYDYEIVLAQLNVLQMKFKK